jgi:hypothetical protein
MSRQSRQPSDEKAFSARAAAEARAAWEALVQALRHVIKLIAQLQARMFGIKSAKARAWHLKVSGGKKVAAKPGDAMHLLQRHRDLNDLEMIAQAASQFQTEDSDFFADPMQVERLMRCVLEENPPWLYVSRPLAGGEAGAESHSQEVLWREQVTRSEEEMTLLVPDESWRDMPLASLTLRPTRTLDEVWRGRLLDQILPPEVLVDRHNRGELMVPRRDDRKQRLEFREEHRRVILETRKRVPVPIDVSGGSGKGGQLLYILLDYSASMRGKSATLALSVITAALRANIGQAETRYLFRRYADALDLWPRHVEPPLQARTVQEKDALLRTVLATNFNGGSTHVNDALEVACADIETLRRQEALETEILLVTDGIAEILESTHFRLKRAGVKVHTVMVTSEKNPGLQAISDSYTTLNIDVDAQPAGTARTRTAAIPIPRRAFRI